MKGFSSGKSGDALGTSVVWPPTYWRRFFGAIWTPVGVATYIREKVFWLTGHPFVWPPT